MTAMDPGQGDDLASKSPAPSRGEGSDALGPGFRYYLAAFGLLVLALSLGLGGYGMTSDTSGYGTPLAGLGAVAGMLAIIAGVVVLLIAVAVGATGLGVEKRAAVPSSTGGDTSERVPAAHPYRRVDVEIPQPPGENPGPASARRLAVCSFAATLLPWLGALVDNNDLFVFFVVLALMLALATGVMTSLARTAHPAEVRDRRHAWSWLVASALSLGLLFVLMGAHVLGPTPGAR